MLNISTETKLSSDKIKQKIKDYFGKDGLNLELSEEVDDCLTYVGGGGYVTATITKEEDKNKIDIVTREWEFQVKDFLSTL